MIGRNLIFGNQDNEWMITFESLSQGQSVDSGLIGGVVGGVVFMLFLVLLIIFGTIIIVLLFSGKQKRNYSLINKTEYVIIIYHCNVLFFTCENGFCMFITVSVIDTILRT